MSNLNPAEKYDVVIMGGGPAGSTLGALLKKQTHLSVAIFEKEKFPRQHIGESFSHRVIPHLEESGALSKVLASGCAIRKYGGFYDWDVDHPHATFFDHHDWENDGIRRWAIHANRAEFDKVLLDHARDCGCEVFEQSSIRELRSNTGGRHITLENGRTVEFKLFVEASGRRNNLLSNTKRSHLSEFRNFAIWTHVVNGLPAQSLQGDWNIFREPDLSPIGCFACEAGWYWYIPVPQTVGGKRVVTRSVGLVTNPQILNNSQNDYKNINFFMAQAKKVPLLKNLIAAATPIHSDLQIATNYSMINDCIADYDQRGLLLGDAAYFVDPLFSSGVAFALMQASAASNLIRFSTDGTYDEFQIRELWDDYDSSWRKIGRTFALAIDQWYYAISKNFPKSAYWNRPSLAGAELGHKPTFQHLVNTSLTPDLLQVLSKGENDQAKITKSGPMHFVQQKVMRSEPRPTERISLKPNVLLTPSLTMKIPELRPNSSNADSTDLGAYWTEPERNRNLIPPSYSKPNECTKMYSPTTGVQNGVRYMGDGKSGEEIFAKLKSGRYTYAELSAGLDPINKSFLHHLCLNDLVDIKSFQ